MNITAVTKFKQGDLWNALKTLGWSQRELARRCRCSQSDISDYVRMVRRPSKKVAVRIAKVFAAQGINLNLMDLWPEVFKGFPCAPVMECTAEVPLERLLPSASAHPMLEADAKSLRELLDKSLDRLTPREREAVEKRYYHDMDFKVIGQSWTAPSNCGRSVRPRTSAYAASCTTAKGIRKLRRSCSPIIQAVKRGEAVLNRESFEGCPELRIDLEVAAAKELATITSAVTENP